MIPPVLASERTHPARRRSRILVAGLIGLLAVLTAAEGPLAATWFVDAAMPDDSASGLSWETAKRTIAAAIGVSAAGDTILVKYGLYAVTDAVVVNSDRCLGSDDGTHTAWDEALPDSGQCMIVADGTCRVMTVTGAAVTRATVIRGFTLTGGDATNEADPNNGRGGGMDVNGGADPIVERCRMTGNLAGHTFNGHGGGLSVRDSGTSPEIRHCRIDGNTGSSAWYAYGGGVNFYSGCRPDMHDCVITGNQASIARVGAGGGLANYGGNSEVRNCLIADNVATTQSAGVGGNGGGVYSYAGWLHLRNCTITGNRAGEANGYGGSGGGVCFSGEEGDSILENVISGNIGGLRGDGNGGGIYTGSGPHIRGNLVEGNYASASDYGSSYSRRGYGGGIRMADSNTEVVGNTVRGNVASLRGNGYGGGIYYESTNMIERNVFQDNVASDGGIGYSGYGGGAYTGGGYRTSFRNNTLVHNANVVGAGGGAGSGCCAGGAGAYVENNIFHDHDVTGSDGVGFHSDAAMTIGWNCFFGNAGAAHNELVTSNEEHSCDPLFIDPVAGDFALSYDSPEIESGNPAATVPANGGWRVDLGAIEYTGTRHLRAITGAGEYLFGGQVKARVNLTDPGTVTQIDMVVHPGEEHPLAHGTVSRWYAIAAPGENPVFDLTLSYLDGELGGAAESGLAAWRRAGGAWEGPKYAAARDMTANWIRVEGQTGFSDWVLGGTLATGVGRGASGEGGAPESFALGRISPNPFRTGGRIEYRLPEAARVTLAIYDLNGRLVRVLDDIERAAGDHAASWDGRTASGGQAAGGVYVCELRAGGSRETRKLLLAR